MSKSSHSEQLVLKGGMLMAAFDLRRTTRDIDLLGLRVENRPERVKEIVEEIASIDGEDGVSIPLDTIVTSTIREADAYQGIRVELDDTFRFVHHACTGRWRRLRRRGVGRVTDGVGQVRASAGAVFAGERRDGVRRPSSQARAPGVT
jgi:hypothetical protein